MSIHLAACPNLFLILTLRLTNINSIKKLPEILMIFRQLLFPEFRFFILQNLRF